MSLALRTGRSAGTKKDLVPRWACAHTTKVHRFPSSLQLIAVKAVPMKLNNDDDKVAT